MNMFLNMLEKGSRLMVLLILAVLSNNSLAQVRLIYGSEELIPQSVQISDLECSVTPVITIRKESQDKLSLQFKMDFSDKKGNRNVEPEESTLFFNMEGNIEDYCDANNKEFNSKAVSGKDAKLKNSLTFSPNEMFSVAHYSHIYFGKGMKPVDMRINKYSDSPLTLNLVIYIGKEKGNSLEIKEKSNRLSWSFILPEPEKVVKQEAEQESVGEGTGQDEVTSFEDNTCNDKYQRYKQRFEENEPRYLFDYYQDKLSQAEEGELMGDELALVLNNLNQFKQDVTSLQNLRDKIEEDPAFDECRQLQRLRDEIQDIIIKPADIQDLINRFDIAVKQAGAGGSVAGGKNPRKVFDDNMVFIRNTYEKLLDMTKNPDLVDQQKPGYFEGLYKELENRKSQQDTIYTIIQGMGENPRNTDEYREFIAGYDISIARIKELSPDLALDSPDEDTGRGKTDSTGKEGSKLKLKKLKLPLALIIVPVILLLSAFGVFKYMKHLKKAKSVQKKLKK